MCRNCDLVSVLWCIIHINKITVTTAVGGHFTKYTSQCSTPHVHHLVRVISNRWHGGAIGTALDLQFIGCGFMFLFGTLSQSP